MKHVLMFTFLLSIVAVNNVYAADAAAGKAKFDMLCAGCHGQGGAGDGPAGPSLKPPPANLTKTKLDDAGLIKIITEGGSAVGRSPTMAAFGSSLKADEIANVVAYIRTLKK